MLAEWEKFLVRELKSDEGLRLLPYNDHLGYATIGIGHLIGKRNVTEADIKEWKGFTEQDAEELFLEDLSKKIIGIRKAVPFFDSLDGPRKTVLVNMSFQMGVEGVFLFRDMLKYLDKGMYKEASLAMLDSLWAKKQTPKRAKKLAERMLSGKYGTI